MDDSISKLKGLLFDKEAATLSELRGNIELVADAERRGHDELTDRLQLLEDEQRRASTDLAARVDPIARRVGTPEAFRASVADVLDDAIVAARETRHDAMTRAVAPLVVKTVQTQLRNSEAELAQMLYPHIGQMVKAYVASAMKDMMIQINRRLETNPPMLWLRSVFSGYSMAELALAETQRLDVDELYLIRRGSGALIQRWPESPSLSNSDIQLSGVIAAINDFSSHAFQQDGGNLRSFNLDDFTVYLRASPVYLLAAKCRGTAVRGVEGIIDAEFVEVVSRQHDSESNTQGQPLGRVVPSKLLAELKQRLETDIDAKQTSIATAGLPFHPLKALATLLALAVLAGGGWLAWTSYEANVARAAGHEAMEQINALKGFPLDLEVGWRGHSVSVSGFAPSDAAKTDLQNRLQAVLPKASINIERIAVLPTGPDLRPQLAEVRRDVTGLVTGLGTEVDNRALRRSLDRAVRRLEQTVPELKRLLELRDPAKRGVAAEPAAAIEQAMAELATQRQTIVAAGSNGSRLTGVETALARISAQLQQAAGALSVLVGGDVTSAAPPVPRPSTPADPIEAAEDVGLAAERVATIATAAVQASSVRIPQIPPPQLPTAPTPRERLQAFVRANAIFFADGDAFRAPDKADAVLDELARLIKASTGSLVRVVGYTDERGGTSRNVPLSQTRAEKVAQALESRGAGRDRLIVIGRANGLDLSAAVGPQSPNRRVEFEVAFDDENAGVR